MNDKDNKPKLDGKELFARVNHLEQNQSAMQTDINTIKSTLDRLVTLVSTAGKTNWGVIAAFMSVGLMIVAPVLYSIKSDNERERSERIALSNEFRAFRHETIQREIQRAKSTARSEILSELNREHIDQINSDVSGMLQTRFTNKDGVNQEERLMSHITEIERRIFDHQSTKGGHE